MCLWYLGYACMCYVYALMMCILIHYITPITGQVEVTTESDGQQIQYSAKIINPENKGGYILVEWRDTKFTSIEDMRDTAFEKFDKFLVNHDFLLGYMTPGKGVKGKQFPLTTDDQLKTMYTEYFGRKSVMLWLKVQVKEKKRPRSDSSDDAPPPSKRSGRFDAQMKRMDDVQEIVEKLKDIHSDVKYST